MSLPPLHVRWSTKRRCRHLFCLTFRTPQPTVLANTAARLFVLRAQAVKPDFSLTNQNARSVAELCARLDGLPLAIELAAARIKMLTPEAILGRIEHTLDLLTGVAQDAATRHGSLRATLDWSYSLMSTPSNACSPAGAFFQVVGHSRRPRHWAQLASQIPLTC